MKYDTNQIEQYLTRKLPEAEAKAFEQRMKEDKDFAYEVWLHETAIETVQYAAFMKRVEKVREDIDKEKEIPVIPLGAGRRKNIRKLIAIAASLLIIPLLYFLIPKNGADTGQLIAKVAKEISPLGTTMGENDGDAALKIIPDKIEIPVLPDSMLLAFPAAKAVNTLQLIAQQNKILDISRAYKLGVFHFEKEQFKKAHFYFDLLIANDGKKRPEAIFYKAFTYFEEDKIMEAKEQLEQILTDNQATPGLKDRVKAILKTME